jgi:hypothetical protein
VPPRNPTTKQVRLPKEPKYDLVTPMIPPGVTVEGDMLGAVGSLKFSDHDLADLKKFPELVPHNYLCTSLRPRLTRTHSRATGVGNMTAMNMHIEPVGDPTFWQKRRNQHLHQVIVELHPWKVSYGWTRPVSIDTQLIVWITGLSSVGEDPLPLFTDKTHEKELAERMKEKYDTHRGARGLDVVSINDDSVRFVMQVLACKLLRKCHRDQVPTGVIKQQRSVQQECR